LQLLNPNSQAYVRIHLLGETQLYQLSRSTTTQPNCCKSSPQEGTVMKQIWHQSCVSTWRCRTILFCTELLGWASPQQHCSDGQDLVPSCHVFPTVARRKAFDC